jgi:hypothetical protein
MDASDVLSVDLRVEDSAGVDGGASVHALNGAIGLLGGGFKSWKRNSRYVGRPSTAQPDGGGVHGLGIDHVAGDSGRKSIPKQLRVGHAVSVSDGPSAKRGRYRRLRQRDFLSCG